MKTLLLFLILATGLSVAPISAHGPTLPPDPWCPNGNGCGKDPDPPPCEGTLSDPYANVHRVPTPRAPTPRPHR